MLKKTDVYIHCFVTNLMLDCLFHLPQLQTILSEQSSFYLSSHITLQEIPKMLRNKFLLSNMIWAHGELAMVVYYHHILIIYCFRSQ
jgi:hypothetical protein